MHSTKRCVLIVLSVAASAMPSDSRGERGGIVSAASYFPLSVGNQWTYYAPQNVDFRIKRTVFDTTRVEGVLYYVYGRQIGDADSIRSDDLGSIWRLSWGREALWFDLTLADGATYEYAPHLEAVTYTVTVRRNVVLDCLGGQFEDCVELSFDDPRYFDDEISYTLAPGVGIVRQYGAKANLLLFSAEIDEQVVTAVEQQSDLPRPFALEQNYPNPFNHETSIRFSIRHSAHVTLSVYDVLGREVARLVDQRKPEGAYRVGFDASRVSSGVYCYELQAGSSKESRRLTLLK